MTEDDWLNHNDFATVSKPLRKIRSGRKWRLFAIACVRRFWLLVPQEFQRAVEVAERFVERQASDSERAAARPFRLRFTQIQLAAWYAAGPTREIMRTALSTVPFSVAAAAFKQGLTPSVESGLDSFSDLLREIFGNPFRECSVEADWLAWNHGTVMKLSQGIQAEQAFDRLPILGDALEEAGCTDESVLAHCRQPAGHVRGCWLVDLLTNKR
jgi:hypothetical protein